MKPDDRFGVRQPDHIGTVFQIFGPVFEPLAANVFF